MDARHTLQVALTEPLARHVAQQVATGHHAAAGEVVRAASPLLIAGGGVEQQRAAVPGTPADA